MMMTPMVRASPGSFASDGGAGCPPAHDRETGAAVDRPIVAGREGHHGLAAAPGADGRVVLARPAATDASLLRHGPAAGTALRVVDEPLAGEEGLLPGREHEGVAAIAAGQRPIRVHPPPHSPRPFPRGPPRPASPPGGAGPPASSGLPSPGTSATPAASQAIGHST